MKRYHQFLPQEIQPMREDMVVVGRAMTVLESDVPVIGEKCGLGSKTFGKMLEALDEQSLAELKTLLTRIQDHLGGSKGCRSESDKKE